MSHIESSNSTVDVNLGNVPDIEDPAIYEAILNIHTAIEALNTAVGDTGSGANLTLEDLQAYVAARTHIRVITADHLIEVTDGTIIIDATANTVVAQLPTADGISGTRYVIKCRDNTFAASVSATGSETIDGETVAFNLYEDEALVVQSDGINWIIV